MSKKESIILFLGNADSDASTAKLKATNRLYKRKMLESGVENWSNIVDYFDSYSVNCVVIKLTKTSFTSLITDEYNVVANQLLAKISQVPNLVLAHESLLTGVQTRYYEPKKPKKPKKRKKPIMTKGIQDLEDYLGYEEYWESEEDNEFDYHIEGEFNERYRPLSTEVIDQVTNTLNEYSLNIIPYSKNVEMSIIASSFIEQNEHNLIFRIYVPSERIWASEAERLLQLFRDYLQKASGLNARHDQFKTNNGVIHEFFGDDETASASLSEKFKEFTTFMDVCVDTPELAEKSPFLNKLNSREVSDLVSRYVKEAKRLHIDLKHERERKLLNIRHSLESELSEYISESNEWDSLYKIVEDSIPPIHGVSSALNHNAVKSISHQPKQNIFINSQVIDTFNGVMAKEISGTLNLVPEAQELLKMIDLHSSQEDKSELTSAVHELSDSSVKEIDRITAKHKLKSFILKAGSKLGDVATGVFQTFIENQIGV